MRSILATAVICCACGRIDFDARPAHDAGVESSLDGFAGCVPVGTFAAGIRYPANLNPGSLVVGDVDGDQVPDVLVSNLLSNTVSVLHNRGDATFDAPVSYGVGNTPLGIALGDLDGTGTPDLVVANLNGNTVGVPSPTRHST